MTSPGAISEGVKSPRKKRSRKKSAKSGNDNNPDTTVKSLPVDTPERPADISLTSSSSATATTSRTFQTTPTVSEYNSQYSFLPSVFSLFGFALLTHIVSLCIPPWSPFLAGLVLVALVSVMREWIDLYGTCLSRVERVKFDFTNILATSKKFEFNHTLFDDPSDPPTPGSFRTSSPQDQPTKWPKKEE